jgi:ankyrin repeat protein
MLAAGFNENPEIISLFLQAGADAKLRDNFGKTALDYAGENEKMRGTQQYEELKRAQN